MVRSAFTLIELIFAIVIIGIAVISLPTMNQATMKGIEGNIVQEAIFAASTSLNQAVSAHWDDNSLEPGTTDSTARVIDDGSCGNNPLATIAPFYRLMPGHINQPLHRRCLDANNTGLATVNIGGVNDLNDMGVIDQNLSNAATNAGGYKLPFTTDLVVTNSVIFGVDQLNANPNIKMITATLKDTTTATNTITILRTYSSNIGEVDYYKRSY